MSQPFFDQAHQEVPAEANLAGVVGCRPGNDAGSDPHPGSSPSPNVSGNGGQSPAALVATQAFGLSRLSVNQRH